MGYTWTTTRFLYSKAIYEPDDLTEIDHFILDSLLERLHQVRMQSWNSVNRPTLLHVSNCFKLWENTRTGRLRSQALEIYLKQFVPGFPCRLTVTSDGRISIRPNVGWFDTA